MPDGCHSSYSSSEHRQSRPRGTKGHWNTAAAAAAPGPVCRPFPPRLQTGRWTSSWAWRCPRCEAGGAGGGPDPHCRGDREDREGSARAGRGRLCWGSLCVPGPAGSLNVSPGPGSLSCVLSPWRSFLRTSLASAARSCVGRGLPSFHCCPCARQFLCLNLQRARRLPGRRAQPAGSRPRLCTRP